jgi:hypothetical protein
VARDNGGIARQAAQGDPQARRRIGMGESREPLFADEERCRQATGNAAAMAYALIAYAKECGRPPADAAAFVGRAFAPGWTEGSGRGALWIARTMALNLASCGGEVRALTDDDAAAEARVAGMPTAEDAAFFGLSVEDADHIHGIFGPIAELVGAAYAWRRDGDEVVLTVRRPGG